MRHNLALPVDNAHPLEAGPRGGDAQGREGHHATLPFFFILVTVEVEIVERSARDGS